MKRNMKLGAKIGLGFGSLIVVALALGALAVWSMTKVKTDATQLAKETVPGVGAANEVERDSLKTMYQMRGYAYTDDVKFLEAGRKDLEEVKKDLKACAELADKSASLGELKKAAERAGAKVAEYEHLAEQTVAKTELLHKDREKMGHAAEKYMKACNEFLDGQNKMLEKEIKEVCADTNSTTQPSAAAQEKMLKERVRKMELANDVIDLGNAIRLGNWKAQAERDPKHYQETLKKFEEVEKKLAELRSITRLEANLRQIDETKAAAKEYSEAMGNFLTNWLAREELGKQRGVVADAVLEEAKNTAISGMKDSTEKTEKAAASLGTASTTMMVGLGIGVLVGIVLAVFITRSITKPVGRIVDMLTNGAHQTTSAASQVSASSQSLAQGASEQAAALEETSSSLEEMSSMTKKNAENAQQASSLAGETKSAADKGNGAMNKMSAAIGEIQKSATETAKIIKVIDEIAFQTNLLALNAAVEAARAGEAGKGFAVVAEEVRNLAMRSAEAAKNTASMIEESVNAAKNGVAISADVAKTLEEITGAATKVNALVGEIAAASNEQTQGIGQVNTAVSQMDKVTQSNAASAEESASAAEELAAQAEQLQGVIGELTALVSGAAAAREKAAQTTHTSGARTAPAKKVEAKPSKASALIPLDGEPKQPVNFAEFSKAA